MENSVTNYARHPFYNGRFAWLPIFIHEKGDEWNSTKLAVRWLFFLVCDGMNADLDLDIGLGLDRFHIRVGLPYINFYFTVNFPVFLDQWSHRNLWRVGRRSKYKWQR